FGSKVWLLHVAAPDPDFVGYGVGPQYIRDFRADELKDHHKSIVHHVEYLKEEGIEADGLVLQGAKIEMILQESKKLSIDLIIA
ncbi:MAG: universal stress protein, partial [bacterium]